MSFDKALTGLGLASGYLKKESEAAIEQHIEDTSLDNVNQTVLDDDVTAGDVDNIVTKLQDSAGLQRYRKKQEWQKSQTSVLGLRQAEVELLFSGSVAQGKVKEFWAREYKAGVMANSQYKRGADGEEQLSAEEFVDLASEGRLNDLYNSEQSRQVMKDARHSRSKARAAGRDATQTQAYRASIPSIGSGRLVTLAYADEDPSRIHSTDNFMQALVAELKGKDKALTILSALMMRWKVELPTFLKLAKTPGEWKAMQKYVDKNPEHMDTINNLKLFLEPFGIKDFRMNRSRDFQLIQDAMLKVADVESEQQIRLLLSTTTSTSGKEKTQIGGGSGLWREEHRVAEAFATAAGFDIHLNEDYGASFEFIDESRRANVRIKSILKRMDKSQSNGVLTLKIEDWLVILPVLVFSNWSRKTPAWKAARTIAKSTKPYEVANYLRTKFVAKRRDPRCEEVIKDLMKLPFIAK